MIGYDENKGIVPKACDEIFNRIRECSIPDEKWFEV